MCAGGVFRAAAGAPVARLSMDGSPRVAVDGCGGPVPARVVAAGHAARVTARIPAPGCPGLGRVGSHAVNRSQYEPLESWMVRDDASCRFSSSKRVA